jgi:hypothetical protein
MEAELVEMEESMNASRPKPRAMRPSRIMLASR